MIKRNLKCASNKRDILKNKDENKLSSIIQK